VSGVPAVDQAPGLWVWRPLHGHQAPASGAPRRRDARFHSLYGYESFPRRSPATRSALTRVFTWLI